MPAKKSPLPQSKKRQWRRLKAKEEAQKEADLAIAAAAAAAEREALARYAADLEAQRCLAANHALQMVSQRAVAEAMAAQPAAHSAGSQCSGAFRPPRSMSPPQYGFLPGAAPPVGATRFSPGPRSESPEVAESAPAAGLDLNAAYAPGDSPMMHRAATSRGQPERKVLFDETTPFTSVGFCLIFF